MGPASCARRPSSKGEQSRGWRLAQGFGGIGAKAVVRYFETDTWGNSEDHLAGVVTVPSCAYVGMGMTSWRVTGVCWREDGNVAEQYD